MPTYQPSGSNIHFIVRGLLIQGDTVILCRTKGKQWFSLPGGHVENGENAAAALERELQEEMDSIKHDTPFFIGVCENIFPWENDVVQHEVNIIFKVNVLGDAPPVARENHIEFVRVAKKNLEKYEIRPAALKEGIRGWLAEGKMFFSWLSTPSVDRR